MLQPQRFATLLLYLNEPEAGGETTFPRWINAETREALKATPKRGKAVLFYSYLPDGNMDDLSQHSAAPVIEGEKWLINLWVRFFFLRKNRFEYCLRQLMTPLSSLSLSALEIIVGKGPYPPLVGSQPNPADLLLNQMNVKIYSKG